jgi:hypothetical protein
MNDLQLNEIKTPANIIPVIPNIRKRQDVVDRNSIIKFRNSKNYTTLHQYMRRRILKSKLCVNCLKKEPYDLANISGEYKREISDWKWLCRKCHLTEDGRIKKLINFSKKINKNGERNPNSSLTKNQVKEIRERLNNRENHSKIAKDYNVCASTISHISSGRNWRKK